MMNLFEISTELQNIYNAIEENEGEITPEIAEALEINEENLRLKLHDYSCLIKSLKTDVEACNIEAKRIASVKKSKEALIEKLSTIVADAVDKFGMSTKTGGKYYDLGTQKISLRYTEKCEINEDYVSQLGEDFNMFLHRLEENGLIGETTFTDDYLEHYGNGLNRDDLQNLKFNISFVGNVLDITDGNRNELLKIMSKIPNGVITYSTSKTDCKNTLNCHKGLAYANLIPSKSITIK